ncbi:hypothetical protein BSPLISOX_1964 [uncultured Gammaproteobacteria bacterium]|nr:hypothetical protein [uncultured Gammaproteobacteria bacterium]CAC9439034.1 hypothetical protein [uncultured Gammaproteobacteria bacterium]VVH65341.1 hypothetical protein BSPLISOX_1964 [uncultured Gammaproteobacteria bacterium]
MAKELSDETRVSLSVISKIEGNKQQIKIKGTLPFYFLF